MDIINWLRSNECVMFRRTIDFNDSDTQVTNWFAVDSQTIFDEDWWTQYSRYDDAGTYTPGDTENNMCKWAVNKNAMEAGALDEIRDKITIICADPSKWVKNILTISLWMQNDDLDYEILFTIINPKG